MIYELSNSERDKSAFLKCLKVWRTNHDSRKEKWLNDMGDKVKVYLAKDEDENVVGMVQIIPIEYSNCSGHNIAFIQCLLVNFYDVAFGNKQKQGYGTALLNKAIQYAKESGFDALAAWGTEYNGLETVEWYQRHGFELVEKLSYTGLVWMPFEDVVKPGFIRRKPIQLTEGKIVVSVFNNGWCTSSNILSDKAREVAREYTDVILNDYNTFDRAVFLEHGIMNGIFINGEEIIYYGTPIEIEMRQMLDKLLAKNQ